MIQNVMLHVVIATCYIVHYDGHLNVFSHSSLRILCKYWSPT